MLMVEKPVVNGAQLVDKLAGTGTGDDKLALPRQLLAFLHRKEHRIANANEVLQALEKGGAPPLTLEKARQIAAAGEWVAEAKAADLPVEKLLLVGTDLPPEPEPPAVEAMAEEMDAAGAVPELSPLELRKPPRAAAKPKAKPKAADLAPTNPAAV